MTTNEQAELKAAELSEQLKVKVHPIVFKVQGSDDNVVGFLKEPDRIVKLRMLDKSFIGGFSAASEVLDVILLKDYSDPRIYSERSEDDVYYLGAVSASYDLIKFAIDQFKKK